MVNKIRPSCARIKIQLDLFKDFPKCVVMEIVNSNTRNNELNGCKYKFLPIYCKTCILQGHNEQDCRVLHLELKQAQWQKVEKENNSQQEEVEASPTRG